MFKPQLRSEEPLSFFGYQIYDPHRVDPIHGPAPRPFNGFHGGENKFVDASATPSSMVTDWKIEPPTSGIVGCISCPAQGTGESEYLGRSFFINSIHLRGTISLAAIDSVSAGNRDDLDIRVCIVLDKQTNGIAIDGENVFLLNTVKSFRSLSESDRYTILYDTGPTTIKTPFENNGSGSPNVFNSPAIEHKFYCNKIFKEPIKVRTKAPHDADVATVTDNSISVIAITSVSGPQLSYETRMRFSETK